MKKTISLVITLMLVAIFSTNAQSKIVHGKVTAFNNLPLAKVEVIIKKSKKMVLTNLLGEFEIECQKNDKISIKADGFRSSSYKVKNLDAPIHVIMTFGGSEKDIKDAARAGHMEKEKLTLAFEKMEQEKWRSMGYTTIPQMVVGLNPTVSYVNGEFRMRGDSSLNGSNAALVVLNGGISSMSTIESIPVEEVKKIKVLKGPAGSIYGSQGANGVVQITTK